MQRFKIEYLDQLDTLIKEEYVQELKNLVKHDYVNYLGFIRYILMINDRETYFSKWLTKHVMFITKSAVKYVTKFGVDEKLTRKNLNIIEDEL